MYAQLGNIKFEGLKGLTSLADTQAVKYAEVNRINRKPNLQRVGDELQTYTISVFLHADFADPERDISEFEQLLKDGSSVPLILGNGAVLGSFLITSITRTVQKTADDGSVIYLTAEMDLKEFGDQNRREAQAVDARKNAYALGFEKVVPSVEVAIAPTDGAIAGSLATAVNVEAVNISAETEKASSNPSPSLFDSIGARSDVASLAALELANKVRALQAQVNNAEQIASDAESVATFAANIKAAAESGNISELTASNSTFQQVATALQASTSTLVQLIALRKI